MMQNQKCEKIWTPSRGSSVVVVARVRAKAEPQITPRPRTDLLSRSFYSRKWGRQRKKMGAGVMTRYRGREAEVESGMPEPAACSGQTK
jgi:hypothetical protein